MHEGFHGVILLYFGFRPCRHGSIYGAQILGVDAVQVGAQVFESGGGVVNFAAVVIVRRTPEHLESPRAYGFDDAAKVAAGVAVIPLHHQEGDVISTQQGELARQDAVDGLQSVKVDAAGQGAAFAVLGIPAEAVIAGLLRPLAQDRHPLPGHRKQFQAHRTRFRQEVGEDGLAVERIGRVLLQLGFIGQADQLTRRDGSPRVRPFGPVPQQNRAIH